MHAFSSLIDPSASISNAWFSFEDVPLKWHYPVGLLYDLFSGSTPTLNPHQPSSQRGHSHAHPEHPAPQNQPLPWRLVLHLSEFPDSLVKLDDEGRVLHDAWINSIKEADFLRNGTAKAIMALSKEDSTKLWESLKASDFQAWSSVHNKLLPPSSSLRHIPVRFYLPTSPRSESKAPSGDSAPETDDPDANTTAGHIKVVQVLVPAQTSQNRTAGSTPQTLGYALKNNLPSLFPSSRTPITARPVLHGAIAPMSMNLEEAMRSVAFADGWLHVGIDLMI
ncbi:MAG: autophagy protein 5 [Stictis urceolatum]|nr:autophagy protein 5 [Stictis urceolata]